MVRSSTSGSPRTPVRRPGRTSCRGRAPPHPQRRSGAGEPGRQRRAHQRVRGHGERDSIVHVPPPRVLPRPAPAHPRGDALWWPGGSPGGAQRRRRAFRGQSRGRGQTGRGLGQREVVAHLGRLEGRRSGPKPGAQADGGPTWPAATPTRCQRPTNPAPAARPAARSAPARWPSCHDARAGAPEQSGHDMPPSWGAAAAPRLAHARRKHRLAPTPPHCRLLTREISRGCRECRTARTTGLLYISPRGRTCPTSLTPAGPLFSGWAMRNGPLLPQRSGNQSLSLVHGMPPSPTSSAPGRARGRLSSHRVTWLES